MSMRIILDELKYIVILTEFLYKFYKLFFVPRDNHNKVSTKPKYNTNNNTKMVDFPTAEKMRSRTNTTVNSMVEKRLSVILREMTFRSNNGFDTCFVPFPEDTPKIVLDTCRNRLEEKGYEVTMYADPYDARISWGKSSENEEENK